jgi:hypothetical protein
MKQCPACKTTYTDDSLSFCLADGTALDTGVDEQPTVVKRGGNNLLRVDIAPVAAPTAVIPNRESEAKHSSGNWIRVVLAILALGVLAIGAIGLVGAAFYYGTGGKANEIAAKSPTPPPTVNPTPDTEKERLRDELANIQKKLDEQKRANLETDKIPIDPDDERGSSITATVDSPNDGFLALRSLPDAERGERILRIPHGAQVEINNCGKTRVTIGGRTGRWCQVEYSSRTGWVFDAWLNY